jgi:hypothetical protein
MVNYARGTSACQARESISHREVSGKCQGNVMADILFSTYTFFVTCQRGILATEYTYGISRKFEMSS